MPSPDDMLFGQIAARRYMAKAEHINLCLQIQATDEAAGAPRRSLGQILVERGFITAAQVEMILEAQRELSGPKMIGKYQIIGKLGEGGMGAVYKAVVPSTGLEVALKILPKKFSSEQSYVTRFRREASVGMGLDHPNIVHTFDVGDDKGVHFIALELVEGGDLDHRIKQRGIFPDNEALGIIREVALGLQHAHEKGLVHRDIKPPNILFDSAGHAKLSDLGLVKMTDPESSHLTQSGMVVGTPHYIAPEQARGESDIDVRADIYALGATLYRLVTGKTPFEGANALEIITKHLNQDLVAPDEVNPTVGDGCTTIIEKMMAKDRNDRYAQPAELIRDIDRVLAGQAPESGELAIGKSSVQISAKRRARAPGRAAPPLLVGEGAGGRGAPARIRRSSGAVARLLEAAEEAPEAAHAAKPSRTARRPSEPIAEPHTAQSKKDGGIPVWAIGAGAAGLLLIAGLAIAFGSSSAKAPEPKNKVADAAQPANPDRPKNPQPVAPPPVAPAPKRPAEEQAQEAFTALTRFEGLKPDDTAGRKKLLEQFLAQYGDSIVAARARVLLVELEHPKAPVPAEPLKVAVETPLAAADAVPLLGANLSGWDITKPHWDLENGVLVGRADAPNAQIWKYVFMPIDFELAFNAEDNKYGFHFGWSAGSTASTAMIFVHHGDDGLVRVTRDLNPTDARSTSAVAHGKHAWRVVVRKSTVQIFIDAALVAESRNVEQSSEKKRSICFCAAGGGGVLRLSQLTYRDLANAPAQYDNEKSTDVQLAKGLVAHWTFDEGKGSIAADSSGNKNDGKIVDAPWVEGKSGTALAFDGVKSFVDVPDSPSLRVTDAMTISLWYRNDGNTRQWASIAGKAYPTLGGPENTYGINLDGGEPGKQRFEFRICIPPTQTTMIASHAIATAGQWRHVVGVSDPASTRVAIYVDGVKDAELTVTVPSIATFPTPFRIGDDAVTGKKVKGAIGDVRIYNRALSDAEVQALYDEAAKGAVAPAKILWSSAFEKDDAQNAVDKGSREQDTIFGANGYSIKSAVNTMPDGYFTSVIGLKVGPAAVLGNDSWIRFACRTQGAKQITLHSGVGGGLYEKNLDVKAGEWQWVSFKMSEYKNLWKNIPPQPSAGMPFTGATIYGVGNKNPTTVWIANVTIGDGPMPQVKAEAPKPAPAASGASFLAKLKPEQTCDFEGALPEPPPDSTPYKLVDDPGPHGGKHVAIARQNSYGYTPIDWQPKPGITLKGKTRLMLSFRLSRPVEEIHINLDYMVDGQKCRAKCVRAFPPGGKWITASVPITGEPLVVFATLKGFNRRSAAGDMLLAVYNSAVVPGADVEFRLDDLAVYEGEPGANGEDEWFEKPGSGWHSIPASFGCYKNGIFDKVADQIKNFDFTAALASLDEALKNPGVADSRGHLQATRDWVAALNAYELECEKGLSRATGSLVAFPVNGKDLRGTIVKSSGHTFSLAPAGGGQNIEVLLADLPADQLPSICGLDKTKPETARMMALHAIFQRKFSIARRMLDVAAKGGLEVGLEFDFLAEAERTLDAESKH